MRLRAPLQPGRALLRTGIPHVIKQLNGETATILLLLVSLSVFLPAGAGIQTALVSGSLAFSTGSATVRDGSIAHCLDGREDSLGLNRDAFVAQTSAVCGGSIHSVQS